MAKNIFSRELESIQNRVQILLKINRNFLTMLNNSKIYNSGILKRIWNRYRMWRALKNIQAQAELVRTRYEMILGQKISSDMIFMVYVKLALGILAGITSFSWFLQICFTMAIAYSTPPTASILSWMDALLKVSSVRIRIQTTQHIDSRGLAMLSIFIFLFKTWYLSAALITGASTLSSFIFLSNAMIIRPHTTPIVALCRVVQLLLLTGPGQLFLVQSCFKLYTRTTCASIIIDQVIPQISLIGTIVSERGWFWTILLMGLIAIILVILDGVGLRRRWHQTMPALPASLAKHAKAVQKIDEAPIDQRVEHKAGFWAKII